jgi:Putative MetA-pathway of phenol degradation
MNIKATILGATMGALGLTGLSGAALAFSTTPPGERAGIDLATPLPEGIYFVDTGSIGNYRNFKGTSNLDYNVPIVAWATPWTLGGGRFQIVVAAPTASGGAASPSALVRGIYNPFVAGQFAYNFGNGFSASYLAGAYIGVTGANLHVNGFVAIEDPWNQTTFHQQLALAYHGGGWNATANLMYGIVGRNGTCGIGFGPLGSGSCNIQGVQANYFNYDLALTHTFGKWEFGIIGYGSTDTKAMSPGAAEQSQFALGGLVGYNFGPVITQVVLGTDVYKHNYAAYGTNLGIHVIIPLWAPEAPKAVVAKY